MTDETTNEANDILTPTDAQPTEIPAEADEETPEVAPRRTFASMELEPELLRALSDMGYSEPMEVQAEVYDLVMAGRDVMVQSHTGSGKTAAFGIPTIQKLDAQDSGAQALMLAPTRELALQVANELGSIAAHKDVTVVPIYGGAPMKKQVDALADGAQIIAGTPGRVLDHIRRGTLKTGGIKTLVLDECDEMLSMGFQEEIENIIEQLPPREERQTMLFSATIPSDIQRIAKRHMTDPELVSLSSDHVGVEDVDHYYYVVSGMARTRDLLKIMHVEKPESAIVFCNTREDTNVVASFLRKNGYDAEAISSDLSQSDRERVMKRMRAGNLAFLVATDVAARGIDISNLPYVINYTFPESPEVYVHRTGRTGRAGKSGVAISLVGPREIGAFYYLKLIYKIKPEERDLPTNTEMTTILESQRYQEVIDRITEQPSETYRTLARRLLQSDESERVVSVLLQRLFKRETPAARPPVERAERTDSASTTDADATQAEPRRRRSRRTESRSSERDSRSSRTPRDEGDGDGDSRRGSRTPRDEGNGERRPRRRRRRDRDVAAEAVPDAVDNVDAADTVEAAHLETAQEGDQQAVQSADTPRPEPMPTKEQAPPQEAEPTEAPAEAIADEAAAVPASAEASENNEAGEAEERPRRRRRRRRARGSDERTATTKAAPSDSSKEFWEAWADEKKERTDAEDNGAGSSADSTPAANSNNNDASNDGGDDPAANDGQVRLYLNIGRREQAASEDIRAFVLEAGDVSAELLGKVQVRNTHTYLWVPEEAVDPLIESLGGKKFGERDVVVERARR